HYAGEFYRIENVNLWRPVSGAELRFGPTADFENASSYYHSSSFNADSPREDSSMIGAMTRLQYDRRYVFLTAGARYDRHNRYGEQTALEAGPGVHLTPSLDLMGRFATAYKAPTLFELYDPKTGNDQLQ